MKSLTIFFVALGLLLTGIALPVCAQDETPAPAVVAPADSATETPKAADTAAPAAPAAPTAPAAPAVPVAAEKTEPVSQPEAPALAAVEQAEAGTQTAADLPAVATALQAVVSAEAAAEKPATPAAVPEEPAEEKTESATAATEAVSGQRSEVSAEQPSAAESAAPAVETPAPAAVKQADSTAETPKATDTVAPAVPAAAEKTEPVSQPEAQAPAAVEQAEAGTQATVEAAAEKPATPAAVPEEPAKEETESATAATEAVSGQRSEVSAEQPSAAESAAPAVETPAPAVEKPSATAPEDDSAKTPAAAVPEEPAEEKTIAEKVSDFELDRDSMNAVPESSPEAAAKVEVSPQPKASFWGRLFSREKGAAAGDSSQRSEVRGQQSEVGAVGTSEMPSATATDMAVTHKMLTPEELLSAQEEVRRQAREVEALKALDLAYQAMGRNEFDVALKFFNQAMNVMPVRPHTVETRQKAMQSQAECEYRIALNYYKDGKYQEVKEAIRRVLGYYPAHQKAARLSKQIKKDETQRIARAAMPVPVRRSAEHLDRVKQIQASIDLGRQYYAIGEYEQARREFKNVLVLDEKNEEAAAQLKKVYDKMYNLETDQMNRQQAEMISQVRDTWTPPVKRETAGPEARIQETMITDKSKRRLLEKLNGIVIPQLEFRQANIVDVIKYLDQASIACDKDSPPSERGVNFILQLRRPGAAAEWAPTAAIQFNEGELTGEGGGAAVVQDNLPTVTLSLRNIVLLDAIKYITEVTGLKYRIEENVVVITPSDVVYGELITRTYKVQPSIAETIMGAAVSAVSDRMELGGAVPTVERGDVKQFFVDAGVPFPEGTSIVYKPSLNLLIAKNTADNLESFERILTSLNVVPVQVEIEARFVEVAQDDLEELGVEWLLTDNWELAENASAGAAIPLASRERIQMNQNTFSKGLRNLTMGASGITATPGGSLAGILSISSVLTNPEVTMVLHALEQRSGANLLSAPKVTTKSGANAEIKVVKELIYPTEFELTPPQVSGSGSGSQAVISKAFVTPAAFQTRDTGVILNVTPTVGPDGFSIDLIMMPQVVELSDWINYGSTLIDPTTGRAELMNMPQPIFHSRNITTSITIWDGQTVVMGGLITEQQTTTLDKIPILGDIPLLGFLFRSKTSSSKKFNLLIFVTANLVDPAGNKINKELVASAAGTVGAPAAVTP
ncbi:MAG: hypothetical protein KKF10_04200 [Verrucomicrobia bacterium]|nr:hypothetical protein [Verrucomicrobiota bacterium]